MYIHICTYLCVYIYDIYIYIYFFVYLCIYIHLTPSNITFRGPIGLKPQNPKAHPKPKYTDTPVVASPNTCWKPPICWCGRLLILISTQNVHSTQILRCQWLLWVVLKTEAPYLYMRRPDPHQAPICAA